VPLFGCLPRRGEIGNGLNQRLVSGGQLIDRARKGQDSLDQCALRVAIAVRQLGHGSILMYVGVVQPNLRQ
jgi:hypothetical protein